MKPNQIITYYVRDEKKPLKRFTPLWLNDNRKWECYDESDVTLMKWCKRRNTKEQKWRAQFKPIRQDINGRFYLVGFKNSKPLQRWCAEKNAEMGFSAVTLRQIDLIETARKRRMKKQMQSQQQESKD